MNGPTAGHHVLPLVNQIKLCRLQVATSLYHKNAYFSSNGQLYNVHESFLLEMIFKTSLAMFEKVPR